MATRSQRPYLLRALFDWIVDSELTPYLLVAATDPSVVVPEQYVNDGKIVLNVSPSAVRDLVFGDDLVFFDGRFAGTPFAVEVPVGSVLAIYAKETGEGMMFDAETSDEADSSADSESARSEKRDRSEQQEDRADRKPGKGPHLKIIK